MEESSAALNDVTTIKMHRPGRGARLRPSHHAQCEHATVPARSRAERQTRQLYPTRPPNMAHSAAHQRNTLLDSRKGNHSITEEG